MKDVLVRAGSSLLAAVVGCIVLTVLSDSLSVTAKVAIAIALGAIALGISVWAARKTEEPGSTDIEVASNLKGGRAKLEDVRAEVGDGESVKLASNIEVDGDIEIKGASVTSKKVTK